jgi:hypothetical protein
MPDATRAASSSPTASTLNAAGSRAPRIALLYPGTRELRDHPDPANGRFAAVYAALTAQGAHVEAAIWHDDFADEVSAQLAQVDAVLAWVNPIEDGRDRGVLDAVLAKAAASGVHVSARPDVILKLGTKQVLFDTRHFGWGCDTHVYRSLDELRRELPPRLAQGRPRVLKQYRGNGGNGVWKVELAQPGAPLDGSADPLLRVRHARRGSVPEQLPLAQFIERCAAYFSGAGRLIDQAWQDRLPEGMVRCYLVHGRVAGFGVQAVNALYPAPEGAPPEAAPPSGPRLYYPPTLPEWQRLKQLLEEQWVPALRALFDLAETDLPLLWDCDFMLGPKDAAGRDSYVLCEINVSSVSPFPDAALAPLAAAACAAALRAQARVQGGAGR